MEAGGRGRGRVGGRGGGHGGRGGRAGGQGGRGRGRGRGQIIPVAPIDDSGSENEGDGNDLDSAFQQPGLVDVDSDADEQNPPEQQPQQPPLYIPIEPLGNQAHQINHAFVSGASPQSPDINRFFNSSPTDIVLSLAEGFFEALRSCSNSYGANLVMKDIYCYHAFLTLVTAVRLNSLDQYWDESAESAFTWSNEISRFKQHMPRHKFNDIRHKLKGYQPEDDVPAKRLSWKVNRPIQAVRQAFKGVMLPGEFLSLDEGMAQGSSTRNPLYVSLGKAKPLEGFRIFVLVDYATKVVLDFMWDDKFFTAGNSANFPGGYSGRIVYEVVEGAGLPGEWYKVFCDNYYITVQIAEYMLNETRKQVGGTMQKKFIPDIIKFGNAKRPKPSAAFPKGSLRLCKYAQSDIYLYSWMDSAGVYFLDPVAGPGKVGMVGRRNNVGVHQQFQVPLFIQQYNQYMHGVDVFDQVRKGFGVDLTHRTNKYTVRVFEILFSMILAQAYNIHRHLHKNNPHRRLSDYHFKLSVVKGLLAHPIVVGPINIVNPQMINNHQLMRFKEGTASGAGSRRKTLCCRNCPSKIDGIRNQKRNTQYYCNLCEVGFHPECFIPWHQRYQADYRPPKWNRAQP